MAIEFVKFDDLEKILPEQLKITGRKLHCVLLGVTLALILTCIGLAVALGVHRGGMVGSCTSSSASEGSFSPLTAQGCKTVECLETAARLVENMDKNADPCQNFHQYACGGWSNRHSATPDLGQLTIRTKLQTENDDKIRKIIEEPILNNTVNSSERKLKDYFKLCLHDYGRMRDAGKGILDLINQHLKGWYVLDPNDWQNHGWSLNDAISDIQGEYNVDVLIRVGISQDYRSESRDSMIRIFNGGTTMFYRYYLRDDKVGLQEVYMDYMRRVATLLIRDANLTLSAGEQDHRIEQFVEDAYGQEKQLAQILQDIRTSGDAELYRSKTTTLGELETNYTQLPWREIVTRAFDGFEVSDDTKVYAYPLGYLQKVNELLRNETTNKDRIMNNYIVWQLVSSYSKSLSWEYKYAGLRYYETAYGVTEFPPTWEECLSITKQQLGSALAAEFLGRHANRDAKKKVVVMYNVLKKALFNKIDELHWMDNNTKENAKEKVAAMNSTIAFPDSYFNQTFLDQLHSKLDINSTYGFFKNFLNVQRFQRHMRTLQLKAGDSYNMWLYVLSGGAGGTYPNYFWRNNYLLVPPGAMQEPYFQEKNPSFINFGGLGSQMADEMTSSIGYVGRFLWKNGSTADWWSPETAERYVTARECFASYYDGIKIGPFLVNGENMTVTVRGDYQSKKAVDIIAGIRTAYKGYQDWVRENGEDTMPAGLDMSRDQAFFLSVAQTQCYVRTDEMKYTYARYQYIPEDILYNGALSHIPEFAAAFACAAHTPMATNNTCHVF